MSNPTARGTLTGELMVAAVILLFAAFVLVFFLYLRAMRYSGACPPLRAARAPLVFVTDQPGAPPRRGLDPALIHALPSMVFDAKSFGACVECAVCLSELCDGEAVRVLPECAHAFHSECIDMWLLSNSTCPLCRLLVLEPCIANNGTDKAASSEKLERVLIIDIPGSAGEFATVRI